MLASPLLSTSFWSPCCRSRPTPLLEQTGRLSDSLPATSSSQCNCRILEGHSTLAQGESQPPSYHCVTLSESLRLCGKAVSWGKVNLLCRIYFTQFKTSYNIYNHVWTRGLEWLELWKCPSQAFSTRRSWYSPSFPSVGHFEACKAQSDWHCLDPSCRGWQPEGWHVDREMGWRSLRPTGHKRKVTLPSSILPVRYLADHI